MKSPVPFLKPKSYYASPFKALVTKDEIVVQRDPIQHIVEDIVVPEEPATVDEPAIVEEPATVDEPLVKNTPLIEIDAQFLSGFHRFLHCKGWNAAGHWHTKLTQDFLALVLVNLHEVSLRGWI
jgi:hypothetical protein